MDFPKEHHLKKKLTPSVPPPHYKYTSRTQHQTPVNTNHKGRVRIDRYQYDEQNILGQGYTSKVYLGRLIENDKSLFAIKVVDKRKISKTKQNLQLLKQQMLIHKQLDHPNIVKCYDIVEKNSHYYFILEYCPNGTLDAFIKKHQKLKESVTISIMEQIIAGYKYLLQMKVLHRDLKPPNILKSGPNWKICDFGFSVIGKKKLAGEINVGTPAYMAPEALQRTFYSHKTDIFSLGVLCYQMLFGVTPWQHKNEKVLLQMIKEKNIHEENFEELKNKNLVAFIVRCCDTNEKKRMGLQQFESFSFWNEQKDEPILPEQKSRVMAEMNPSTWKAIDRKPQYSSTCYSQATNNTSQHIPESRIDKSLSNDEMFKGNSSVVQRQLYFATLLYYLMRNYSYMLFEEAEQKQLFLSVLGKHARYILRRINHQNRNYFGLKRWQQYSCCAEYKKLRQQASALQLKVKQLISSELKKKTIINIRLVNKNFDELTYDQNISSFCINNLKDYLVSLMDRTIKRYESIGRSYIVQNSWTAQVLDYLLQYYKYLKDAGSTAQKSRFIAMQEQQKDRSSLVQKFEKSTLSLEYFQFLKKEVEVIQN